MRRIPREVQRPGRTFSDKWSEDLDRSQAFSCSSSVVIVAYSCYLKKYSELQVGYARTMAISTKFQLGFKNPTNPAQCQILPVGVIYKEMVHSRRMDEKYVNTQEGNQPTMIKPKVKLRI